MYLGIDVGGTKTLFAVFTKDGDVADQNKIATHRDYGHFLTDAKKVLGQLVTTREIRAVCCAVPGRVERRRGIAMDFGNLAWHNVPIKSDLKKMLPTANIYVENDANLAGLSEALLVQEKYKKVLYITVSTGIGGGIIINGKIDKDFEDFEPGQMVANHEGKLQKWEAFASGSALKKRYGKLASEINDASIWRSYSLDIAVGLQELLAVIQPEAVIVGGGVGSHFEKFSAYLEGELYKLQNPLVKNPPIIKAKRPEEAVIYGCFDFIKQND